MSRAAREALASIIAFTSAARRRDLLGAALSQQAIFGGSTGGSTVLAFPAHLARMNRMVERSWLNQDPRGAAILTSAAFAIDSPSRSSTTYASRSASAELDT